MLPRSIPEGRRQIQLPASSTRLQSGQAFCQILTFVSRETNFALGFEGRIYRPGAKVDVDALPKPLIVLECAGPIGPMVNRKKELVWILWRYEWAAAEWKEIARASSYSWEWAVALREPAYQALRADLALYDVLERGRVVAAELGDLIVARVSREDEPVRKSILSALYQRLAGEIAERS